MIHPDYLSLALEARTGCGYRFENIGGRHDFGDVGVRHFGQDCSSSYLFRRRPPPRIADKKEMPGTAA
jgi:hypothetical protein